MYQEIAFSKNTQFVLPSFEKKGNILLIGNLNNVAGSATVEGYSSDEGFIESLQKNQFSIYNAIHKGSNVLLIASKYTIDYFKKYLGDMYKEIFSVSGMNRMRYENILNKHFYTIDITDFYESEFNNGDFIEYINKEIKKYSKGMKFDYIVQNPPYKKSLHLDFFEKGLEELKEDGEMVIIEPATWLINVRKNGRNNRYDEIKKQIDGHVKSVMIENLNKDFNTNMFMPFAITTIDMSKTFDDIDFTCCGETKKVKSIYDCNLIGNYDTIWSIFKKVLSFGNMMKNHIIKKDKGRDFWYTKYAEIVGGVGGALCAATTDRLGGKYDGDTAIFKTSFLGEYCTSYTSVAFHFFLIMKYVIIHCMHVIEVNILQIK